MKTPTKALLFMFFISLLLLICPLHLQAEEEVSTQIKNIQILITDEDHKKVINVSIEDIKKRLLKGEPVHFVEKQDKAKRTIEAEWITNALKKEYGVEKIYIRNAIITGDLDFHIKDNLVDIEKSGIEVPRKWELVSHDQNYVSIIFASIRIERCLLLGNLEAGFVPRVIFRNFFMFTSSRFEKKLDFSYAQFKGGASFMSTRFNDEVNFKYAESNVVANFMSTRFYGNTDFTSVSFNGKTLFSSARFFNDKASFRSAEFNGESNFNRARFYGELDFGYTRFSGKADFSGTRFEDMANFRYAKFNGDTDFGHDTGGGMDGSVGGPIFKEKVDFRSASFNGKADFDEAIFEEKADFSSASFNGKANFDEAIFEEKADYSSALFKEKMRFDGINFKSKADFSGTNFEGMVSFTDTNFIGNVDFGLRKDIGPMVYTRGGGARFNGKMDFSRTYFQGSVNFSYVDLENANLSYITLRKSKFIETNLKDAILSGVDLTGSQYEPYSPPQKGSLGGIEGLRTVWFQKGQQSGLVQLRAALKEAGLRDLEREATYAIEHWKAYWEPWYKKCVKHLLFEWTCAYGLDYLRPLLILLGLIVVFSIPYIVSLGGQKKDGIWIEWASNRMRKDLGQNEPYVLKSLSFMSAVRNGFYFSILSAFHIGWRDLNVGSWIARIQPREYTLKATGWVRVASGAQSLISIYLLALWALTQFGRPFE